MPKGVYVRTKENTKNQRASQRKTWQRRHEDGSIATHRLATSAGMKAWWALRKLKASYELTEQMTLDEFSEKNEESEA